MNKIRARKEIQQMADDVWGYADEGVCPRCGSKVKVNFKRGKMSCEKCDFARDILDEEYLEVHKDLQKGLNNLK